MEQKSFETIVIERLAIVETNLTNHLSNHKNDRKLYLGGLISIFIAVIVGILITVMGG